MITRGPVSASWCCRSIRSARSPDGRMPTRKLNLTAHVQAKSSGGKKNSTAQQAQPYSPPARKLQPTATVASLKPVAGQSRGTKLPLLLAGIVAFTISGYCAYLYVTYKKAVVEGSREKIPEDVSERYNVIAPNFDLSVDTTETLMGLTKLRKELAQKASGDVCEVSIGTGRNLSYYDWSFQGVNGVGRVGADKKIKRGAVKSFTAIDKSAQMLEVAHDKFSKEYPGILGVRWVIQDASDPIPSPPQSANERSGNKVGKKYDTIIQTMGLCSAADPVRLLKNLGDSIEPDGRILLLEHGQGTWDFINNILDGLAPRHATEFGCWWNRDIGKIVEESGLDVVQIRRKHFGTTWVLELRSRTDRREVPTDNNSTQESKAKTTPIKKSSWW